MTQHWQLETLDPKGSASDGGCLLGGLRHSRHDSCTALSRGVNICMAPAHFSNSTPAAQQTQWHNNHLPVCTGSQAVHR